MRIYKTQTRKTIEKINETKSCLFQKINKIDNLSWMSKEEREKTQITRIRNKRENVTDLMKKHEPWLVWLSGLNAGLWTERSLGWIPVRAHAWVAGRVLNWGRARSNQLISLSLSFSLPFPFSKNKWTKSLKSRKKEIWENTIDIVWQKLDTGDGMDKFLGQH